MKPVIEKDDQVVDHRDRKEGWHPLVYVPKRTGRTLVMKKGICPRMINPLQFLWGKLLRFI